MGLFFGSFALFLLIGVPISLALGVACVAFMWWTDNLELLAAFPQRMIAGVDQFVLLTIPLFVLAGNLMSLGGITDRIVSLSRALIGHVHGGLSLVNITASMFFSGVSGSATAEAAAIGSVLIPAMEKEGYPIRYAAALTAVASVMGPIIPPSIAMIVYGVLTGTSIAKLFIAGIIPGLMIGFSLMIYAYWRARRHGYPVSTRSSWKVRLQTLVQAGPAIALPLIILGGILSGIFTPTESAAVAVIYAVVLAGVFYRTLSWRALYTVLWDTAFATSGLMIVVAVASMVAFVFSFEGVPQKVATSLLGWSDNKHVILLLINIVLLILGLFLEPISIMILTLPVLTGIVKTLGVDMVHFGLIVVLNVVIGLVTPPVGVCLFVTSAISKVGLEDLSKAAFPMIMICVGVLMLITYIPTITLFLPSLFG